jgi:hypothetical protein
MNKSTIQDFIEKPRKMLLIDSLILLPFLILPLLISLPYRVNIFLSWEGAYRMSIGQTPFVDFGIPMGFGYWLIPTLFFKLFGPGFLSLVKAQILINFLSAVSLRGLLYNMKLRPFLVSVSLLVFYLTYVIYNFWPWYNHSVVVFELIALYFATREFSKEQRWTQLFYALLAASFAFLSFFTKQDVGAVAFVGCLMLIAWNAWLQRSYLPLIVYVASFVLVAAAFILPFVDNEFFYWFNFGQPPHNSRITLGALLDVFFVGSITEKIYLVLMIAGAFLASSSFMGFISDRKMFLVTFIGIMMILQSVVTRVSSPLPTDHMTYFHVFGFIGIISFIDWNKLKQYPLALAGGLVLVLGIYSGGYWKYASGIFGGGASAAETGTTPAKRPPWVAGNTPVLRKILLPPSTLEGVERLKQLPVVQKPDLKVLNMSELTYLAHELGYVPLTDQPLWYHLNIGIFPREVEILRQRIATGYYDLVLFEDIPSLTHFYPYVLRDQLMLDYDKVDSFLAPRRLEDSTIEVFVKRTPTRGYAAK